ncbi:MAG: TonB family protein [Bacteroidetes bacterium]|nr:TonB family protein [Bacteroidota bacterium]
MSIALIIVVLVVVAFIAIDWLTSKISLYDSKWTNIVFDDKNKAYGAYELRKIANKNVMTGVAVSVIALGVGLSAPLIATIFSKLTESKDKIVEVTTLEAPPPIDKTEPPPPPPEAPPPPPLKSTVKFVAPEIVKDEEVKEEPPPTVEELKDVDVGKKTEEGDPTGVDNSLVDEVKVIDETPQIFTIVEQMPGFPGGEEALIKYISSNFRYPAMERENNITGTVYLTFVVRPSGEVSDIKVLRGVNGGPNLEKEAIRVVKSMPKWKPGKQNGKEVSVQYNLPVRCVLK